MSKLKVVIKRVGFKPEVMLVDDSLHSMQAIVGGPIEAVIHIPGRDFSVLCLANEEGKIHDLPPNFLHPSLEDVICGDVVWHAADRAGNSVSLPDEMAVRLCELIKPWCPIDDEEDRAS